MGSYKAFAVTVQGSSHIKSGTVCQDASDWFHDESVSIAVVADGHGDSNCFRSDRGSTYAVKCAIKGIKEFVKDHESKFKPGFGKKPDLPSHREFEKLIREKLIRQTVASWNMLVMEDHKKNHFTEQELEKVSDKYRKRYENGESFNKAYGTSLIAAAITPWYCFGFHIGDGRFSVLYQDSGGGQPVPWDPKCYLNVTTSICDDDILDRGEEGVRTFLSLHSEKAPPVAFFLCSDGIDDNYPVDEKENAECLYKLYREIAVTFAEDGYESTFGKDGRSGQLKDLANNFAIKGKGDDTSIAGILNIEELKESAPKWKEKMAAKEAEMKKAKAEAAAKAKADAEAKQKTAEEIIARREARRAEREKEEKAKENTAEKNAEEKNKTGEKPQTKENTAEKSAEEKAKTETEAKTKKESDADISKNDINDTQAPKPQLGTKIDITV
jgi:serine/threonine protein phosphatase PrpC